MKYNSDQTENELYILYLTCSKNERQCDNIKDKI